MKKYKIEGDIDFYAELYKSLDDKEENVENSSNVCLISNMPLDDKFVELNCGHKFNYVPLYNDIVNHKLKFNTMESSGFLSKTQIRCPYCRKKQNSLLPYYENMQGVEKIEFVNSINENTIQNGVLNKLDYCSFAYNNPNFNPDIPETPNNPKTKCCNAYTHLYLVEYIETGETKMHCYPHYKQQKLANLAKMKEIKKKEKELLKEKKKEEKLQMKEEAKQKQKEEKQKQKEEKQKQKEEQKKKKKIEDLNKKEENEVIDVIDLTEENIVLNTNGNIITCTQIIKSGAKKGTVCGLKPFCNNLCKRHYNLSI